LNFIDGSVSLHNPNYPFINCTPRIAKISIISPTISVTFISDGIADKIALTTVLIPSFLETILSGLSALKALNPFANERSKLYKLESIQVIIVKMTMTKSNMFHSSLRKLFLPMKKPMTITFITNSPMKMPEIIF